jgi:predicted MFS family arabinose efflux permease
MIRKDASIKRVDRLPRGALLALAMTGFLALLTETMPAGMLPEISNGVQVSDALAGQFVTFYAIGSLVAAIPLTTVTLGRLPRANDSRRVDPRRVPAPLHQTDAR